MQSELNYKLRMQQRLHAPGVGRAATLAGPKFRGSSKLFFGGRPAICAAARHRSGRDGQKHGSSLPGPQKPRGALLPARFTPHRDIDSLTASPSFTSTENKREGPLMFAYDLKDETSCAIEWVLRSFCYPADPEEKIEIVCVVADSARVDSGPTQVGQKPGGVGAVTFDPIVDSPEDFAAADCWSHAARLRANTAAAADQKIKSLFQGADVPYQIHISYIPGAQSAASIGEVLLEEADRLGARTLIVASHGPGALAEYGSVARHAYSHASIPLLLIPTQCPSYLECEPANVGAPAAAPALDPMPSPPSKESHDFQEGGMAALKGAAAETFPQELHSALTEAEKQVQQEERYPAPGLPWPFGKWPFAPASPTPSVSPHSQDQVLKEEQRNQAERARQGDLAMQHQRESAQEAQHLSRQVQPRSAMESGVMTHRSPGMRPSCEGKPAKREVLVVVSNLEELEDHWQWIADNTCHKGDTLTVWHVDPTPSTPGVSRPPSPERTKQRKAHGQGLASLPIALNQVLRVRGLRDVKFQPIYSTDGKRKQPDPKAVVGLGIEDWHDPTEQVARQVCMKAAGVSPFKVPEGQGGVRLVCVLNYNRLGFIAEAMWGSVASHLSRTCTVPLLLLQPAV